MLKDCAERVLTKGNASGEVKESSTPTASTASPGPGVPVVPDHELLKCIGRGSYGEVWLARNIMGAYRAVKIVFRATFDSDRPYLREFEGLKKFEPVSRSHESQLSILHIGRNEQEDYFYHVMELADDQRTGREIDPKNYEPKTLRSELAARERLPSEACLKIGLSLTTALEHLHQHDLIHRDIKLSNIIFVNGLPKLADIGLVAKVDATCSFVGTEGYLPPEGPGTRQADLYSLGKVLYEISTGKDRREFPELPVDLGSANEEAGLLELNAVAVRACEPELRQRYASAALMHEDLLLLLAGKSIRRTRAIERRLAWLTRLAAVVLAVMVLGAIPYYWAIKEARRATAAARRETTERQRADRAAREAVALRQRAEENLLRLELQRADDLLVAKATSTGLAHLARLLRQHPTNTVAAARLISTLSQVSFPLLTVPPLQHESGVMSAEFSSNGRQVVTVARDNAARVWDAFTGTLVRGPMRHNKVINTAHFSPDGLLLLTASGDSTAQIWDLGTGQASGPVLTHPQGLYNAEFSPDGERIVTSCADGAARLWNTRTGLQLIPPCWHQGEVLEAHFSPDGKLLVTASLDKTARVWDARTGRPMGGPLVHLDAVLTAGFSPDSRYVVTGSEDKTARIWDALTGGAVGQPMQCEYHLYDVRFSPEGRRVLTSPGWPRTWLWDAHTGKALVTMPTLGGDALEFAPDGDRVSSAGDDFMVRILDARTGQVVSEPCRHEGDILGSARFSPGSQSVITVSADKSARIWDIRPGQALALPFHHRGKVLTADLSLDGTRVVTGSWDKTARVWDVRTGQAVTGPIEHGAEVTAVEFSRDGRLFSSSGMDGTAQVWDAQTGQPVGQRLRHDARIFQARFSPDGQRIVTVSKDFTARIWEAQSGRPLSAPLQHEHVVTGAQFSPDGRHVATVCRDGMVRIWEVDSGNLVRTLNHDGEVFRVQYSADGQRLLTGSDDGTARLWNMVTGAETFRFHHDGKVRCARFSPDDRRVLTASWDKSLRLWDALNGQPLLEPLQHREWVHWADFSPDGGRFVSGSADTARIWDARTGEPLTEPILHEGEIELVKFGPNGDWVLSTGGTRAQFWEAMPASLPIPDWLPELAEALGRQRFNAQNLMDVVPITEILKIKQRLMNNASEDSYIHWGRWFFADRAARPISPSSSVTLPMYVSQRIQEDTLESLREAVWFSPTNALALARLARRLVSEVPAENSGRAIEAEWYACRAGQYARDNAEVAQIRSAITGRLAGLRNR